MMANYLVGWYDPYCDCQSSLALFLLSGPMSKAAMVAVKEAIMRLSSGLHFTKANSSASIAKAVIGKPQWSVNN